MTEEIASTPSWVEERLDAIFAALPNQVQPARDAYAACLARNKAPAAPSDLLGAEFEPCRRALHRDLLTAGIDRDLIRHIEDGAEALEAELASES